MTENMLDSSKESALVKFYVQAARDAHILLSPEPLSMAYEIVLGAGTNTFCDIRKAQTYVSVNSKKKRDKRENCEIVNNYFYLPSGWNQWWQ